MPAIGIHQFDIRSYINHSSTPNLVSEDGGYTFLVIRDIAAGEELYCNYNESSDDRPDVVYPEQQQEVQVIPLADPVVTRNPRVQYDPETGVPAFPITIQIPGVKKLITHFQPVPLDRILQYQFDWTYNSDDNVWELLHRWNLVDVDITDGTRIVECQHLEFFKNQVNCVVWSLCQLAPQRYGLYLQATLVPNTTNSSRKTNQADGVEKLLSVHFPLVTSETRYCDFFFKGMWVAVPTEVQLPTPQTQYLSYISELKSWSAVELASENDPNRCFVYCFRLPQPFFADQCYLITPEQLVQGLGTY